MAKLIAQGYELLDPGRYVLEVLKAEAVNEYGPQLKLKLRVSEGEHEGFEFTDYPNRGAENGVKVGTKAWDVFEAMVSVKKTGKGNRTEHGTLGPHRPKQVRPVGEPDAEQPDDADDDFSDLPF